MKHLIIVAVFMVSLASGFAADQKSTPAADEAIRKAMLAETAQQREEILSAISKEKSLSAYSLLDFFRDYGLMPGDKAQAIMNPVRDNYKVEETMPDGKKRSRHNFEFLFDSDNFDPNPMAGNYEGSGLKAQVVQMPAETFFIHLVEDFAWKKDQDIIATGIFDAGKGHGKGQDWKAELGDGKLILKDSGGKTYTLKHVVPVNPVLGKEPPAGAEILIDKNGNNVGMDSAWRTINGGLETTRGSQAVSKKSFDKPVTIHLEFRIPNSSYAYNQQRGNSGLYMGKYEIQLNDNYGFKIANNHCGGLYSYTEPLVNATRPPAEWQAYDVNFVPEVWNEAGDKLLKNARVTALQNGIKILDDFEIIPKQPKDGEVSKKGDDPKLLLQNHTNKLQFRNFWFAASE